VAQYTLGELGTHESAEAGCRWPLVNHLSGLVVWLLPVAAIVLLREIRRAKALLIVLPIVAANLLWMGIRYLLQSQGIPSSFDMMMAAFIAAIAVILLVMGRLKGMNRLVIAFLCLLVTAAAFGAAFAGTRGLESDLQDLLMIYGVMAGTAVLAPVLAGVCCRRRFGGARFVFWLGAWCVVSGVGMLLLVFYGSRMDVPIGIVRVVVVGAITGAIVYALLLPFVILALWSGLYRERLYGCFRLQSMLAEKAGETGGQGN